MYSAFAYSSANQYGGNGGGNTQKDSNGRVAGQYTGVQNPFNFGVTIRFDY
jgi:hypothetical protein